MMIDMQQIYGKNELPLQDLNALPADGGFVGIFRKIGVIGDSLSSGEFQAINELGCSTYHDLFDYSWGKYLGRLAGTEVEVCARGGMTAEEFVNSYATLKNYWPTLYECDAIIIALGVNDASRVLDSGRKVGKVSELDPAQFAKETSFINCYARIIAGIKSHNPYCHFFLVTPPVGTDESPERTAIYEEERDQLEALTKYFQRTYLVDLRKYAPVYDEEFRAHFFMDGHMNPSGYLFTAKLIGGYMDYIIRHEYDKFHQVGFTHSPIAHPEYFK